MVFLPASVLFITGFVIGVWYDIRLSENGIGADEQMAHLDLSNQDLRNLYKKGYKLKPYQHCTGDVELLLAVTTCVTCQERRNVIRQTWGAVAKKPNANVRLAFFVGETDNEEVNLKLIDESKQYKDIVQTYFKDTYLNLTLKTLSTIKWVKDECSNAIYVLKVDDDMFINVPLLLQNLILSSKTNKKFFLCHVVKNVPIYRSKFTRIYVPRSELPGIYFPDYCFGGAYAFTGNEASGLYEASLRTRPFRFEDVLVTGFLAAKLSIPIIHHSGFNHEHLGYLDCSYRKNICGHRLESNEILNIWKDFTQENPNCYRR